MVERAKATAGRFIKAFDAGSAKQSAICFMMNYLHEIENADYYLPTLDEALTVIIETYSQIQTESD